MSEKFLRIYKKMDFNFVKSRLLIYGALSGSCASCKAMDIKLDVRNCPQCKVEFTYVAFMNIKDHMPKMLRLNDERSDLVFVDYEDFKKIEGVLKAENFLK
jgi:hypothetical protein